MDEKLTIEPFARHADTGVVDFIMCHSYFLFKRVLDIIVGLIGVVLLIPITIIIKICYMLSGDFNPIIFKQDRIGKDGKLFKFYKFRTMVVDADKILEDILEEDGELAKEYRKNKKLKNDPRITKVGKMIRKFSIDELPQFINVLKGNMTLIGNRPYLPREKKDMGKYYEDIVKIKPGITGYWQVNGRSDCTFHERLVLEEYYSKHYTFIMDIKIFLKTFKVVLFGKDSK